MRPRNAVEILIDRRRKQLGIGRKELALATVGSQTTWTSRSRAAHIKRMAFDLIAGLASGAAVWYMIVSLAWRG